nr:hypothetical protein [Saccharothrix sp. ST-888]
MPGVVRDVVRGAVEPGGVLELQQLGLLQYPQRAALVGRVVGDRDLPVVGDPVHALVLQREQSERGDRSGADRHGVGAVAGVELAEERQVLEGVELDVPGGQGLVGQCVVVEGDQFDVDALGLGLLLEDVPVGAGAGDADPDLSRGAAVGGAVAGRQQSGGENGGGGGGCDPAGYGGERGEPIQGWRGGGVSARRAR